MHMVQWGNNTYMCNAIRFPEISKKNHIPNSFICETNIFYKKYTVLNYVTHTVWFHLQCTYFKGLHCNFLSSITSKRSLSVKFPCRWWPEAQETKNNYTSICGKKKRFGGRGISGLKCRKLISTITIYCTLLPFSNGT